MWPLGLLLLKTSPVKQYSYENDFSGVFDALHQSFLVLILCGFVVFSMGHFMLSLAIRFVLVFFFLSPFNIVITSFGEESADLFILHVLIFVHFLFLLVSGAGCGL